MTKQIATVRQYFDRLAEAFAGVDPAVAQDATYDAQEFLAGEREGLGATGVDAGNERLLVERLLERFGEPQEVVESYRVTEEKVRVALAPPAPRPAEGALARLFGVFAEPRSYGALIFVMLSLPVGVVYFVWAVAGVALSLGLGLLIFGFFFFLFFVSTVRAVALVECRLVETLLGERMPRRPPVVPPLGGWTERVRYWVTDARTWLTIVYMVLRLPLGIVYFVLSTLLLTIALGLLVAPFVQLVVAYPIVHLLGASYFLPLWAFPFLWLAAAFDLLVLVHAARAAGSWHARLAKAMLARPGA